MSLDIGDALSEGFDRTFARSGLLLMAVFVVFGLVNAIVQQSFTRVQVEEFDLAAFLADFEGLPIDQATLQDIINQTLQQATALGYLDMLSWGVLFAITILFVPIAEAIRIVAVRTFVSDETETVPRSLTRRNIGWATLNGVIGGIVVIVLIGIGLVFFILPGIFLAIVFYFVRQEIAVEDKNLVDAMADSWELTKGSRIEILALAVILFLLGIGVSLVGDLFAPLGAEAAALASVVFSAGFVTYSVAAASRAYAQLRDERDTATDDGDDIEEYLDPELDDI